MTQYMDPRRSTLIIWKAWEHTLEESDGKDFTRKQQRKIVDTSQNSLGTSAVKLAVQHILQPQPQLKMFRTWFGIFHSHQLF